MASDNRPDWRRHERDISEDLGLPQTVASGSVWFSKDDVASLGRLSDGEIGFTADAKSTTHRTYSIDRTFMRDHCRRASRDGRVFLLPVRFESSKSDETDDFIVLSLEDFRYLFGFDDAKTLRDEARESVRRRDEIVARVSKAISNLNEFAVNANVPVREKVVLFNAIDEIEKAMRGL